MKITLLLLIVGVCLVSAKYLPYESDDSNGILLRSKRSDSGESDSSAEQTENSGDDSDDDKSVEKKHREREEKRREKEEKSRRKVLEREEKERRREEEHRRKEEENQRKLEEKRAKEEQKEQERKNKDERKRHEKLEKEKRKQEELQNKAEEKRLKEEIKKQEKHLNELEKEALEPESQDDGFLETEEENSVELEDVWRNHIYTKYGLTFSSTRLEKQAALNKYIEEELGLKPNSTKSERRRAILNLIQTKLQNDTAEREAIRKQVLSHVNAVTLQKLRNDLEKDIEEINNKTNLLKNVSLPWAVPVQETLEEKRTFLQALSQFLANIIPNWISGNPSQNDNVLGAQTNENGNQNIGTNPNVPSTSEISETPSVGSTNEDVSNDFVQNELTPNGSSVNAVAPENEESGTNNDSLVNQSAIGNNVAASESNTAEIKPIASGDEIIISNTNPTLLGNGNTISGTNAVDVSEGSSLSQGNVDKPSLENDQTLSSNIVSTNVNTGANGNEPSVSNIDVISNSQISSNDAVSQDNTSENKPVAGDENNIENVKPVLQGNDNAVSGINSEDISEGSSVSQVNIDIASPSNDQAVPVSTVSSETVNNSNLNNPTSTESNININANENQVTGNNNGLQSVTEDNNAENASNTLESESGASNVQDSLNSKPVLQGSGTNPGDESEGSGNNDIPSLGNDQSVSSGSSAISNGNDYNPTQSSSSSSTIASSGVNQVSSDGNNLENPSSNKETSNVVVDENQGSTTVNGVSTNLPVDSSLVANGDTINGDKKPAITNENKPVIEEVVSVGSTGTLVNPSTENTVLGENESSSINSNNGVENIPSSGSNIQNDGNLVENGIGESETAIKPTENIDVAAPIESDLNSQVAGADEVTSTKVLENTLASATESVILNKNDSVIIPNDSQSQANSITSNNNAVEENSTPINQIGENLTGDSNKETSTVVSENLSTTVTSEIDATTEVAGAVIPTETVSKEPAPVDKVQTISDQPNDNGITNTESESTSKDSYVTATPEQSDIDITATSNDGNKNIANVETQTVNTGHINESVSSTDATPVDVQSEQSTTIVEQGNSEVPEMGTTETVAYTPVNVAEDFTIVAEAGATVVDIVIQ